MSQENDLELPSVMSDTEALMWNIEKDPWLNPSGAMVTLLDRPIDRDKFARRIAKAVVSIPRLRQRVDAPLGRLVAPRWVDDREFDLGHHLRFVALPSNADTDEDLWALASRLAQVPFDRTRPLWEMHVVEGLSGGRGALISKLHHSVADGTGAMRMSLAYMDLQRRVKIDDAIDLGAALAAMASEAASSTSDDLRSELTGGVGQFFDKVAKPTLGAMRAVAGEVATWGADRHRIGDAAETAKKQAGGLVDQLPFGDHREPGSPLWAERSRKRHLEVLGVDLAAAKAAAANLGGTVNDLFVAGAVEGAVAYHLARDVELERLHVSFVVSTRGKGDRSSNAFTPVPFDAPAGPMEVAERFAAMHDLMSERRKATSGGGGLMAAAAGAANLLPTSVMTQLARREAASIDFATSNFRGSPVKAYIAGARVEALYTLGPVAGTAFNLTTLSYCGSLDMGLHVDPVAVENPAELKECIAGAYESLLEHA
ncbi:MAG: wax ester/triacylglycerol synthase family O-acyltransferase [Acidimicrobiales bacterium]